MFHILATREKKIRINESSKNQIAHKWHRENENNKNALLISRSL